jgi:EAL and modified HD-GYP domain-containing signal transduction protein
MSETFFLGRQPILDRQQNLVAYELLFRSGQQNAAHVVDDLAATATVINHAFGELGMQEVLGGRLGFINVNAALLLSDIIEILPARQIVLEILETVELNATVIARAAELRQRGFQLALDDVTELTEAHKAIMPHIQYIKFDVLATEATLLKKMALRMQLYPHVTLLAEKIDSHEQKQFCESLGFHLFQGYYFAKPHMLSGKKSSPSHTILLRLLALMANEVDNSEIEPLLKQSPDISVNLMRLVNSVGSGVSQKISSIHAALTVLGQRQLQRWVQILLFTQQSRGGNSATPLLQMATTRGRLMELLAERIHPGQRGFADKAFMVGMLSLVDALFAQPLAEVIEPLNLDEDVKSCLLGGINTYARLLAIVKLTEQHDIGLLPRLLAGLPLVEGDVTRAETEAVRWVNEVTQGL